MEKQEKMIELYEHWFNNVATDTERNFSPDEKEIAFMNWYDGTQTIKALAGDLVDKAKKRFQKAFKSHTYKGL